MSSSEGKRGTGQQFTNILKGAKRIFRRRKNPTLTLSASSSSGGGVVPFAEIAQQKGSSAEVKIVKDDSQAVPASSPSTSNALDPAAIEVGIAIQTELDVVQIRELQEVNVEVSEGALTTREQESAPAEPTEADEIAGDIVSSDTVRTLERYRKAINRIKKALELRRKSWETFELSGFDSLPLGDEQDIANLQLHIDKVLESRLNALKGRTKWRKSKDVLEQCFRALAPFMKNVLSVGLHAAQSNAKIPVLNPYGLLFGGVLLLITISEQEVDAAADIEKTLDYISRQIGRLRIIHNLPSRAHGVSSEALGNRSLDVKSAALNYVSVHLAHECTRLGIGGSFLRVVIAYVVRIAKTILQGHGEREVSGAILDKAIQEFNSELVTFGTSVGFRTFDTVHDILVAVESVKTGGAKNPAVSILEPEMFIVPFDKNERFTGRKELLRTLKQLLCEEIGSEWKHRVALYGMAGVGKTQTAIEYVYANRETYDRIYWITAETEASILSGFQEIAIRTQCLASLSIQNPDDKLVAKFVLSWLRQQKNWLIVLDNLDDITIVKDYLPARGPDQHTLISTRNPNADGIPARGLEVPLLGVEESIEMLCNLSQMDAETHRISAKDVVEELQHLPLAIEQAASYVRNVTRDFTIYLADYRRRRPELHAWIAPGNRQYSHSLATAWLVSFGFVEREMPVALKFLQLLSLLNPDYVSLDFLVEGKSAFEPDMEAIVEDNLMLVEMLLCLERFSLVKWSRERRTLSIHRLVQAVIKDKMEDLHRIVWASVVVKMCDIVMPKELTNDTRQLIREYQGQVVIPLVGLGDDCSPEGAEVVFRIGSFMEEEGKYTDAENLISIAIRALSVLPEDSDARILTFSSLLGSIKRKRGRLSEAALLLQRTLDIQKVALGPNNSDTLMSINNLALVYWNQGLLSEAAELHKEALAGSMRVLGKDHPNTLRSMNNLAIVYWDQGLLSDAAQLYTEALVDQMRVLGKDHPNTLRSMSNLALVYWDQGLLSEAAELHKEALAGSMRVLGKDHPDTLRSMSNLALVYWNQGLLSEAAELHKEALAGSMRVLGKDHPDTLSSMHNLAAVYWDQRLLAEAVKLQEECLEAQTKILGKQNRSTLHSMNLLGMVYKDQGRLSDSVEILESTFQIRGRIFGPDHLDTVESMICLGAAYVEEGKLDDGIRLQEKALEAPEKVLGKNHNLRFQALSDLGVACHRQGRLSEATEIHISTLADCQRVFGPRHPQVSKLLSNLANDFSKQRRWNEAVECQEKAVEGMRHTYGVYHSFTAKGLQKLEELRDSMNSSASSQNHRDLAPCASLDLMGDKDTNSLDSPSSAAETTTQQIPVTEQTNSVPVQEVIQSLLEVPEYGSESRVAVLES